ncbi:FAD-dependent monooxygenase [Nostoc sp. 'Lobaria pulmonaria (5183) cyanobiont']|uniref:FAD-dependent monooxygenase n=1 Tax=Nostoc sp. 'Lobaria pulmonaria (5183) cyanobiont' TaxID=1618022 RepID=UPI000CF34E75|nr:FAD-dependent monooxygenase [Nostoc sp. 'Lobaria pulmonaria (5183) cyanobiont']AVH71041.1 FAD-binding monooxygenase [Nostoc sp. 'Lobaria pulmonaria (5183) cyanobiont']
MVSSNSKIGIIGAGTSGAYLASLLIQEGFQVDLFEKAPVVRTDGCGILIVQSGMKALDQGNPQISQKIINSGDPVKLFEFRNLKGGFINSETVTYAEDELPGMLVHRKAILEAILDTLPPNNIHFNAQLASITQTENSAIAHFKDGSHWEGDLIVGADGILSKVRQFVVPNVELYYLGDLVWRGIVTDNSFCPEGNFFVYVRGRGIYANFFHIGGNLTHWGFFVEKEQTDSEIGALQPTNISIPPQELAKLPEDARNVIESTPVENIICRYSYDIDPLPKLYDGRVILIGDAAHAKSSTRARGMTSGWEDGLSLTQHLTSSASITEALENYQTERLPIVHEYQRTSREMSQKIGRR